MSGNGKLAVLGGGGFATEIMETAIMAGWKSFEVYDDDISKHGQLVMGTPCMGSLIDFEQKSKLSYILAIGDNAVRKRVSERLETAGHRAISLLHPTAVISPTATIAHGTFVGPYVWVGPHVKIGRYALLNMGVSIGHDALLGDWVQLCPGVRISGFASVGNGAFLGSNAVLGPQIAMEEWSQLTATSFAWRTIPAGALAAGCPARIVNI